MTNLENSPKTRLNAKMRSSADWLISYVTGGRLVTQQNSILWLYNFFGGNDLATLAKNTGHFLVAEVVFTDRVSDLDYISRSFISGACQSNITITIAHSHG